MRKGRGTPATPEEVQAIKDKMSDARKTLDMPPVPTTAKRKLALVKWKAHKTPTKTDADDSTDEESTDDDIDAEEDDVPEEVSDATVVKHRCVRKQLQFRTEWAMTWLDPASYKAEKKNVASVNDSRPGVGRAKDRLVMWKPTWETTSSLTQRQILRYTGDLVSVWLFGEFAGFCDICSLL